MKKLFLLFIFIAGTICLSAQTLMESQYKNQQVLERELNHAKTPEQKTDALISLLIHHSQHNETFNKKATKEYQQQLEIFTHQTKNADLIARALFYLSRTGVRDERKKRNDRLFDYAKLHNLVYYKALSKNREAEYFIGFHSEHNIAQQSLNESLNLTKSLNDSLRTIILLEAGFRYNAMNNHLQALQLAFQANENASKMGSRYLMRISNTLFAIVYSSLENYNKAIEYNLKELELLRLLGNTHLLAVRHAGVAQYFFKSGQHVLGNYHVQEAYRIADSVKGSKRLYNQITGTAIEALSRSENIEVLVDFLNKYRQYFFIFPGSEFIDNVILAGAYGKKGEMDSARLLIKTAGDYLSDKTTVNNRKNYHYVLASLSALDKNWKAAIENYKHCLQITLSQNNITESLQYIDSLKKILVKQNMLPEGVQYYELSDSLQNELNKQQDKEDITRQEVAALEKEKEMQAIAKEREKNQRHNLQYLGITAGVVALFISLILMGLFKVSPRMIKVLNFFAFLLFFEFIFLIFKKQVYVFTQGEPLKDLAFMVLLAAVMVPLHHWGEHKVVEYLSSKKLSLNTNNFLVRKKSITTVINEPVE